jgi:hypothetical protein
MLTKTRADRTLHGVGSVRRQGGPPETRMGMSVTHPTSGGHPVDRLSELLGQAGQFAYTCWLSG